MLNKLFPFGHCATLGTQFCFGFLFLLLAFAPTVHAQDGKAGGVAGKINTQTLASAINISGRQRMLSQRMAKAYLQLVLGVNTPQAQKILAESVSSFGTSLDSLLLITPNPTVLKALEQQATHWKAMSELVNSPANKNQHEQVVKLSDDILGTAQAATLAYETAAQVASARLVNIAGRQRMLAQRMAKLLLYSRASGKNVNAELEKTKIDFVAALQEMNNSPITTPNIKNDLDLAQVQWGFLEAAIGAVPSNAAGQMHQMQNISFTSERILEVMDGVTKKYQVLTR